MPIAPPTIKTECAIFAADYPHYALLVQASADAAEDLRQFGDMQRLHERREAWLLLVDARYSLREVRAYIQRAYGSPDASRWDGLRRLFLRLRFSLS
jgi:hypothetical protein